MNSWIFNLQIIMCQLKKNPPWQINFVSLHVPATSVLCFDKVQLFVVLQCPTNNCSCQKSRGMIGYPSSKAVDMLSGPTWRSDIFPSILRSAIQKTSFIREEKWVLFFCLYWSFVETSQQTIPSRLIWNFWFVCSVKNTISSEKLFVKSESWFTREED